MNHRFISIILLYAELKCNHNDVESSNFSTEFSMLRNLLVKLALTNPFCRSVNIKDGSAWFLLFYTYFFQSINYRIVLHF